MGHLINARAFRLGRTKHWWDVWFIRNSHYAESTMSCLRLRYFFIFLFFSRTMMIEHVLFFSHFEMFKMHKIFTVKLFYYDGALEESIDDCLDHIKSIQSKRLRYRRNWRSSAAWHRKLTRATAFNNIIASIPANKNNNYKFYRDLQATAYRAEKALNIIRSGEIREVPEKHLIRPKIKPRNLNILKIKYIRYLRLFKWWYHSFEKLFYKKKVKPRYILRRLIRIIFRYVKNFEKRFNLVSKRVIGIVKVIEKQKIIMIKRFNIINKYFNIKIKGCAFSKKKVYLARKKRLILLLKKFTFLLKKRYYFLRKEIKRLKKNFRRIRTRIFRILLNKRALLVFIRKFLLKKKPIVRSTELSFIGPNIWMLMRNFARFRYDAPPRYFRKPTVGRIKKWMRKREFFAQLHLTKIFRRFLVSRANMKRMLKFIKKSYRIARSVHRKNGNRSKTSSIRDRSQRTKYIVAQQRKIKLFRQFYRKAFLKRYKYDELSNWKALIRAQRIMNVKSDEYDKHSLIALATKKASSHNLTRAWLKRRLASHSPQLTQNQINVLLPKIVSNKKFRLLKDLYSLCLKVQSKHSSGAKFNHHKKVFNQYRWRQYIAIMLIFWSRLIKNNLRRYNYTYPFYRDYKKRKRFYEKKKRSQQFLDRAHNNLFLSSLRSWRSIRDSTYDYGVRASMVVQISLVMVVPLGCYQLSLFINTLRQRVLYIKVLLFYALFCKY